MSRNLLRQLPSVEKLLQRDDIKELLRIAPRSVVVRAIREVLNRYRETIISSEHATLPPSEDAISSWVITEVKKLMRPSLRRVINATGIILHTNLGRAVLGEAAREALTAVGGGYCNLELDLETGKRGSRHRHIRDLLFQLIGCEDAIVVNNNAAAVLLALNTLAAGREVIVSRGQLIEIGGSFRMPEVMVAAGVRLVEVGTTNKTYVWDYEQAISDKTALLLKVHTSNYRLVGFCQEVSLSELVGLGRKHGLPVMEDLGSGCFIDLGEWAWNEEPVAARSISLGADVISFSGDKLLGGPQAGIIAGKREYIEAMKRNPLMRALRVDKLTLAALEATLREYLDPDRAVKRIPVLNMLLTPLEELERRAEQIKTLLTSLVGPRAVVEVTKGSSEAGGGSLPGRELPSYQVRIRPSVCSAEELAKRLRCEDPAVIGRVQNDSLVIDVRTLLTGEIPLLAQAVDRCLV